MTAAAQGKNPAAKTEPRTKVLRRTQCNKIPRTSHVPSKQEEKRIRTLTRPVPSGWRAGAAASEAKLGSSSGGRNSGHMAFPVPDQRAQTLAEFWVQKSSRSPQLYQLRCFRTSKVREFCDDSQKRSATGGVEFSM